MLSAIFDPVDADSRLSRTVSAPVPSYAPAAAYGVLGATVLAVALGIGFFTYGGVFAPLSDVGGLLVGMFLAPLVWTLFLLNREDRFDRGVFLVGAAATVGIVLGSVGLVVMHLFSLNPAVYGTAFLAIQFLGWFLLGLWLFGIGAIGLRTDAVGRRVSWAGVISGAGAAGGIVALLYSYAVGSFTPAFPFFMAVYAVGFVLWAFWLGIELRTAARQPPSDPFAPEKSGP
ncbi:hypothetical protein [Natrononativus amylolyticus]|uniref:hypothetical protein n=1 Tax=Natrononativus amylolyticus TaxID=2963434 RepID=UPI0020CE6484|nr:hypothetical protein [Natrononativus amylolyticus]